MRFFEPDRIAKRASANLSASRHRLLAQRDRRRKIRRPTEGIGGAED